MPPMHQNYSILLDLNVHGGTATTAAAAAVSQELWTSGGALVQRAQERNIPFGESLTSTPHTEIYILAELMTPQGNTKDMICEIDTSRQMQAFAHFVNIMFSDSGRFHRDASGIFERKHKCHVGREPDPIAATSATISFWATKCSVFVKDFTFRSID